MVGFLPAGPLFFHAPATTRRSATRIGAQSAVSTGATGLFVISVKPLLVAVRRNRRGAARVWRSGVVRPPSAAGHLPKGLFAPRLRLASSATQDFDGHGPVELGVVAEVHGPEAAHPQGAPHLVTAEGRGRGRGGVGRRRPGPGGPARRCRRRLRRYVRV